MSTLRTLSLGLPIALFGCTTHGGLQRDAAYGNDKTTVELTEVPVKGFYVTVEHGDGNKKGELLAVDACFVVVQTENGSVGIPSKDVESVKVQLYPTTAATGVVVLTILGTLSTLSHGYYIAFSAPVWIGTGLGASFSLGRADDFKIDHPSPLLYQFARFPQGLPPGWPVGQLMSGAPPECTEAATGPAQQPPPMPAPTPSAPPDSVSPPIGL